MEMKLLQFMQLIRLKRYHQWMAYIRMHVVNNMKRAMVSFQHLFTPPICHRLFIQGGKKPSFFCTWRRLAKRSGYWPLSAAFGGLRLAVNSPLARAEEHLCLGNSNNLRRSHLHHSLWTGCKNVGHELQILEIPLIHDLQGVHMHYCKPKAR